MINDYISLSNESQDHRKQHEAVRHSEDNNSEPETEEHQEDVGLRG